jgi:hypothetical protein
VSKELDDVTHALAELLVVVCANPKQTPELSLQLHRWSMVWLWRSAALSTVSICWNDLAPGGPAELGHSRYRGRAARAPDGKGR